MNNIHPRPRCEMVNLAYYQNWLIEDAWPVWLEHGVDWEKRAFVEYLDPITFECNAKFRRLRVVTRQIISFSQAFSNNISRSEEAVHLGIEFLINSAKLESGGYARTFDLDNQAIDKTLDLYDHAFVLLAFASAAKITNLENLRTRALGAVLN